MSKFCPISYGCRSLIDLSDEAYPNPTGGKRFSRVSQNPRVGIHTRVPWVPGYPGNFPGYPGNLPWVPWEFSFPVLCLPGTYAKVCRAIPTRYFEKGMPGTLFSKFPGTRVSGYPGVPGVLFAIPGYPAVPKYASSLKYR